MRCLACNTPLTPFEATRKTAADGEYVQLCNRDFEPIAHEVEVVERYDLLGTQDVDEDQ